jgi:precorrin-2 dehydrogenase/sirohydrochlorin ferrochelatase
LDLSGKTVLVVGGGRVAQRKIETLLRCGAEIRLVSKEVTATLQKMIADGMVAYAGADFDPNCLREVSLVIAATDHAEMNRRVSKEAKRLGLLVNAVDQPADCNFIVPSVVQRGDLVIAVSTMGKSPALAKQIRKDLEAQFDGAYGIFLVLMGIVRKRVLGLGLPQEENSRVFENLVSSEILQAIREDNLDAVASALERILPAGLAAADILNDVERAIGET